MEINKICSMLTITEGKKLEEYEVCVCPYPSFPGVSEILDSVALIEWI